MSTKKKREDMEPEEFVDTMSKTMYEETSDGRGDDEEEDGDNDERTNQSD